MNPAKKRQAAKLAKFQQQTKDEQEKNLAKAKAHREKTKKKQSQSNPALVRQHKKMAQFKAGNQANSIAAALKNEAVNGETPANYEMTLAQLTIHLKELKGKNQADKIALKTNFIQEYLPFLDAYREAGIHYPNEVLARVVIWLADCETFAELFDWADYAVSINQEAPSGFKSDLPTSVARAVIDWCEAQYKEQHSAEPYFSQLLERIESNQWPMDNVIVPGRVYKLAGRLADDAKDYEQAVKHYTACMDINPKTNSSGGGGASSLLSAAEAKLKKQQ